MGCPRFHPLISRYLDDDLEGAELDACLRHLSDCAACRSELRSFETIRSWCSAAGSLDPVPEPKADPSLSWLRPAEGLATFEQDCGYMGGETRVRAGFAGGKRGPTALPWWERFAALFSPGAPQAVWRYALPAVAMGMLVFWLYPGKPGEQIDVRRLADVRSSDRDVSSLDDSLEPNYDLYLIEHAAQQPWTQVGTEVPLVRQAAAQSTR